jgi:hypothetical protein
MNVSRPKTLWQRWKQGIYALAFAYITLLIPTIFLSLGHKYLGLLDAWPAVEVACELVFLLTLFIAVPLLVSGLGIDQLAARQRLASAIEPQVDQLAAQVALSWDEHYLSEVGDMLQKGQGDQARKLYRDRAAVTWDEADQALADWPAAALAKKLEIIREHLNTKTGTFKINQAELVGRQSSTDG